jgi:transcriptional regulator with XRE-family HTH domain
MSLHDRSNRPVGNVADVAAATLRPGVQCMIRAATGEPVTGRPDPIEQQQIADGVGALLRELRLERQMGIRDLEGRSGVHRSTISRIEHGLRRPRRSVLGWLAWGLDAENVAFVKARLVEAAGGSLVAESRWSERSHARNAERQLARGTMPVPLVLLAARAVAAFGQLTPDNIGQLREAEEIARRGGAPWPPGMEGSPEALIVAGIIMDTVPSRLAVIGSAAARVNDYGALRKQRRRQRARRAADRQAYAAARTRGQAHGMPDDMLAQVAAHWHKADLRQMPAGIL